MPNTLPVTRVVDVQVSLAALLAQAPNIDTLLLLGTSTVIDTVTRMREYTTIAEVAADFGTSAPEYLAAVLWFGQNPQPETLFIGRWAKTAAAGQLIGGGVTAANLLISAWTAVTAGAFYITVDGIPYALTGMNFSAVTNLNGVASVIQTALQAATSSTQTVVYDATYNRFVVTDSTTGTASTIGFIAASTAVGHAAFSGVPTAADTLVIDGTTVTFVSALTSGIQCLIVAGNLPATLANLLTLLNGSSDANLVLMSYFVTGSTLYIVSKATGTTGNAYTLSRVSSVITLSGAVLAGGAAGDISVMTSATATSSGAYLAPGLVAETAVSAVALFDLLFPGQWYGLVIPAAVDADHEAVAAYVEAANPPHYYGVTTQEAGVLVPGDTSDITYILSLLKYDKTAVQYCSTSPYAIMSYLARILTTAWLGNNTTITLKFKAEPGIVAEGLNTTQANAAEAKDCNVYVNYANGTSFIEQGVSCSGQFTDTVIGADWLALNIQTNVFNVLYGSPTKIPQTDPGMSILVGAAEAACIAGVNNQFLAPGVWFSQGVGAINYGDTLTKGYYVFSPLMATQTEAVRQTRAAPVMSVLAKTAGAIHSSLVLLIVLQ